MGRVQTIRQLQRYFLRSAAAIAVTFFLGTTTGFAQAPSPGQSPARHAPATRSSTTQSPAANSPAAKSPTISWTDELKKYPGLLPEFSKLLERLQHDLHYPAARKESRLSPLLPESTTYYTAFSNYGDAIHQGLTIFQEELKDSTVLRDWWTHGQIAASGPKFVDGLDKLSQLHQYLGEEIVVAGAMEAEHPKLLAIAEVRKPGLKPLLQQWIAQITDESAPGIRVLDEQELATAKEKPGADDLIVLVRNDFVVAGSDLATLRGFNAKLAKGRHEFVSTPFGQRIAKEYAGGVTILAAADLHKIVSQISPSKDVQTSLQRTGFSDVKYLVWEHTTVSGQPISQAELSFNAPRRGPAAWLANPVPLGSMDFVSPKAIIASAIVLENPAIIFDDVQQLAGETRAEAFATLEQGEKALKLSLKDDLLGHLGGEITVELDEVNGPKPLWKTFLKVDDAPRIQKTLGTLLALAHIEATQTENDGVTYYNLRVPSGKTATEIAYAFVDGYWIIASGHDAVAEAVELHTSGASLAKSQKFLAALPPGQMAGQLASRVAQSPTGSSSGLPTSDAVTASALLYEDPGAMTALRLQQVAPDLSNPMAQLWSAGPPAVVCLYGEESAIREAGSSSALDLGGVMVAAAIAIPNLMRSRIAANEASAIGNVRSINTAQVAYAGLYPKIGYATDLSKLGSDSHGSVPGTAEHAGLLDDKLASTTCMGEAWCTKSGYQFRVNALCKLHLCKEYLVVATPVSTNTGARSFCSTSDGILHVKTGPPLSAPPTAAECRAWPPLQ
jgi:hypothetical protein